MVLIQVVIVIYKPLTSVKNQCWSWKQSLTVSVTHWLAVIEKNIHKINWNNLTLIHVTVTQNRYHAYCDTSNKGFCFYTGDY